MQLASPLAAFAVLKHAFVPVFQARGAFDLGFSPIIGYSLQEDGVRAAMATSPSPKPKPRTESRMKQNSRDLSPERAKPIRLESKPKMPTKFQVLYYLSRNGQLEHPHVMEVTPSSNEGLYLRDVLNRLNVLRGKGMPYLFSWSSKRSYKNGYVWHDLAEDDIILPTHGNDYVLKGSELFEGSSERYQQNTKGKPNNSKQILDSPLPAKYQDSVSSTHRALLLQKQRVNNITDFRIERSDSREHVCAGLGPTVKYFGPVKPGFYDRDHAIEDVKSASTGSESNAGESSWSPLDNGEYKVYKAESAASAVDQGADAATQTDERRKARCNKGVSTEDDEEYNSKLVGSKENQHEDQKPTELSGGEVSPPPSSSGSPGSPNSKTKSSSDRADKFRTQPAEAEKFRNQTVDESYIVPLRSKASTVLMQLISCGSIAVKDHSFVPAFRTKSLVSSDESKCSNVKPLYSRASAGKRTVIEDDLDCTPESRRFARLQIGEKEYFSGSIVETKTEREGEEGAGPKLKRCASYNADRSFNTDLLGKPKEDDTGGVRTKCVPRKIKAPSRKQQLKNSLLKTPSRLPKVPSKLGRSFNSASTVTFAEDTKLDVNNKSEPNVDKELNESESLRNNLKEEQRRSESFRSSLKEEQKVSNKNGGSSLAHNRSDEPQAVGHHAEQAGLPTIELRHYLEKCRSAEAVETAARANVS